MVMLELTFSTGFTFARLISGGMWRKDRVRFLIALSVLFYSLAGIYYLFERLGSPIVIGAPLLCAASTVLIIAQIRIGRDLNRHD